MPDLGTDVTIVGVDYPHSVLIYDLPGSYVYYLEYNLEYRAKLLLGEAGIGDKEDASGLAADVSFYGDGHLLKTLRVSLGHPKRVHINASGVLRLKIAVSLIEGPYDGRSVTVSVGNARYTS